jgi:hypothetical protein
MKNQKPLGHRAYGHIPHFMGSRMTPSDKHCQPGQQDIMTKKARDKKDLIIVQEKLDGSNCSIAKINNNIYALTRAGYEAKTSEFIQHKYFDMWVDENISRFYNLLNNGERIVGEWLMQAHGTRYELKHEPFVAFDIMNGHNRMNYHSFLLRVLPYCFTVPRLIHIGQPFKIDNARKAIQISGHGAIDPVEGFVYRCEREGKVDFLAKWVRPDKIDGKYLPEKNNVINHVWNVLPKNVL